MKKYYNINYSLLVLLLTPLMLRNDLIKAFITSIVKPLDLLNNDFGVFVQSLSTSINSQVCYMQAMLNDNFDFIERRIRIRTAPIDIDSFLLWRENKNKPMMIAKEGSEGFEPILLNRDGQISANHPDFEIVFPAGYMLSVEELKRLRILVNRNKITPQKYIIVHE